MQDVLRGFAIAIAASVITLFVHDLLEPPPVAGATGPIDRDVVPYDGVLEALARIEERLDSRAELARPGPGHAAAPRTAASPTSGDASPSSPRDLDGVIARLAAIEAVLRARPALAPEFPTLDRMRAMDVPAIREVIELRSVDREAAEWDLHLRTMTEIVERFGYPSHSNACSGSNCDLYWRYDLPSANRDNRNYFSLYFVGNLVAWFEGRWTD